MDRRRPFGAIACAIAAMTITTSSVVAAVVINAGSVVAALVNVRLVKVAVVLATFARLMDVESHAHLVGVVG